LNQKKYIYLCMKKLLLLLLIPVLFVSCRKDYAENLNLCLANAYDQTIVVKGLYSSDYTIKSGKIFTFACVFTHGYGMNIDVQASWKEHFCGNSSSITVCSEDGSVLGLWTKDDIGEGSPFNYASWSSENKIEKGADGGLKEGLAYVFLVSNYTRTKHNLTFVFAPSQE